ncbi:hypothetical protein E2320_014422, partial [Naja naja]
IIQLIGSLGGQMSITIQTVIFISKEGAWSPALGNYLGQLTSEIPPNMSITEFAAAGPKTYGHALSNGPMVLQGEGDNAKQCQQC